ncbi:uncharacterized protein [Rutidosis leptorrhynchoides]|uniref:uncharacterized protein n=1 Tax=Rutidosis leptorrhynchoides TaxID=125765 RepID=UPI003A9A6132
MGNNKHATKKDLGNILMESFKTAHRDYKPNDIRDDVDNRFRVSISYNQGWRAKCHAIEMLHGSMDDSFRMLPIYLHNIMIHNPGSMTNLVTDSQNKFLMCYMSFGAVIRSFVQYVRPIIIVDGAHLKDGYLGTNLVAVAMDANNGILPLAYRTSDFQDHLSVFQRRLKASYKYLVDVGFNKLSRNQADRVRYAYLTSNSVKSINALSKHARKLPVCMLLEFFRASIQDWFFKHHNKVVSLTLTVTPYSERKLVKRTNKSRRWQTFPSTNNLIEVRDGRKNRFVNLEERSCSCGQWKLSSIPCGHVIAATRLFGVQDVTCYVLHWFTSESYINTYSEHILPLPHRSEWSDPGPKILQIVNPPI